MAAMLQQQDSKENLLEDEISSASQVNVATTIGLSVWAGIVTLAILLIGVMVFHRIRRSKQAEKQWSSAVSQFSDAETGSMRSMSAASSVVDLSSAAAAGCANKAYHGSTVEVDLASNASQPDLNKEELDFDSIRGVYDDEVEQSGEDSYDPSLANAKPAFGTVIPKGANGSLAKGMRSLFFPDKGSSFM